MEQFGNFFNGLNETSRIRKLTSPAKVSSFSNLFLKEHNQ